MDSFTENILARARERQKVLENYTSSDRTPLRDANPGPKKIQVESLLESNIPSKTIVESSLKENKSETDLSKLTRQNSNTRISSEMSSSPKNLKTLNIQKDNFNMEIKVSSSDNIRLEVEIAEEGHSDEDGDQDANIGIRSESKSKLKRLGQLYAGGDEVDISSPIHRTEGNFCVTDDNTEISKHGKTSRKGLSKLAHLAETINKWEDDLHKVDFEKSPTKKSWKPPAPKPPTSVPVTDSPKKSSNKPKAPEPPVVKKIEFPTKKDGIQVGDALAKNVSWDQNVIDKLESQGFTRTKSNTRLVYSYNFQENTGDEIGDTCNSKNESTVGGTCNFKSESTVVSGNNKIKQLANVFVEKIVEKNPKIIKAVAKNISSTTNQPTSPIKMPSSPIKHNYLKSNIAERAAVFENSPTKSKDPALLSVSERKALFEKNKGDALIPKAAFGMAPPVKTETIMKASSTKIINNTEPSNKEPLRAVVQSPPKSVQKIAVVKEVPQAPPAPIVPIVQQSGGIASKMAALLEHKSTISQYQIEQNTKSERQKEMDVLLNRFNRNKEMTSEIIREVSDEEEEEDDLDDATEKTAMIISKPAVILPAETPRRSTETPRRSAEKRKSSGIQYIKGDSPVVAAVLEDVKRIKVKGPKEGKMYPNLSDIEATTTETETDNNTRSPSPDNSSFDRSNDSDEANTSFGRDILQTVCKNITPQKRPVYDESTASDISSMLDESDYYVDDLSNEDNSSSGPTPPKQVRQLSPQKTSAHPSNSFQYKNYSPSVGTPKKSNDIPDKTLPEYIVEGDNVLPLTYTVSFYRKQQNQTQSPARQISRQAVIEEEPKECIADENEQVNGKIKELQDEVNKQQNIISQTSQALNLCSCTPEFSGSTEQVEAEKVLLVATHRRQAALHEIQRLKIERTLRPQGQHAKNLPLEKGTLTISNIVLPLKQKYVKALAAAGGKGHHVVCLIKCGEQVLPTKLTSTVVSSVKNPETELIIPGSIVLHGIYSDFTVTFEVYCLQAQEEFLPHEVKYHINKKSGHKLVTPKKSKQESRMVMPIKESPAGPQAVRSSSFAIMGYVVFSVQAVNKKIWNLNNTPPMSPLEGTVEMKISCELTVSVEHKGFLTMFEDVSGFGAWHRRWCLLKGHTISYWKYPDDEKKMPPVNSINLKNCITKVVEPVNREICARLHTFLLEMERPAFSTDKDSLVIICKGDKTVIRHLLSADTKPERIEWCTKLNAALTGLRMWGNNQR